MLGHTWRLRASNTQNQNITVIVNARFFKFASDGSITWSVEQTLIASTILSATSGTTDGSTIDNSTDRWLGMTITASFQAAANTNGTGVVVITLERSTDGGTTWPTAGHGQFVGGMRLVAADGTTERRRNFVVGG